ncbi:AraC family transcriptional regulator [Brevibacillus agri]|nr:AraC family transcriptional regulator [Brevibacillus agri]
MFHTQVLQQVMAYMEAHYREMLARMAGMSVWHFSRVLSSSSG